MDHEETKKQINEEILEFENEIEHRRKPFFHYEDKRLRTRVKKILKKYFPNMFKFLKGSRDMVALLFKNN